MTREESNDGGKLQGGSFSTGYHAHERPKAIRRNGLPETLTIDGSAANEAAIKRYNEEHGPIIIRQVKYLNNLVEQDHRAVKRVTHPMLGFKSFAAAQDTLVGIEIMHMLKERQLGLEEGADARRRWALHPVVGTTDEHAWGKGDHCRRSRGGNRRKIRRIMRKASVRGGAAP